MWEGSNKTCGLFDACKITKKKKSNLERERVKLITFISWNAIQIYCTSSCCGWYYEIHLTLWERERESIKGMSVNIVTLKPLTNISLIQNLLFTIFFIVQWIQQ